MLVVNLIAGPGSGKTTVALGLASMLKQKTGLQIEYCPEVIREYIYRKEDYIQEVVTSEQYEKLKIYQNAEIDILVQDCSLLNALVYKEYSNVAKDYIFKMFNEFDNITYFIPRNKKYISKNREQSEDQALELDKKFIQVHEENNIGFFIPRSNGTVLHYFPEIITDKGKNSYEKIISSLYNHITRS